jgi:hypothetical protein
MAESQTTLVDRPHGAVHLILSKDNSFNTTMTLDDKPVYRLESTTHLTTTTHIFHVLPSGEKELYMTYKRRPVGSVFEKPDGEKTRASKIMRTHGPLLTKECVRRRGRVRGLTACWQPHDQRSVRVRGHGL